MTQWKIGWAAAGLILSGILLYPRPLLASNRDMETIIDLNYTYEQTHLGENISGETTVQQKYEFIYQSALTSIFDWRINARIEVEDEFGDDLPDRSTISPTLELEILGPRARMRAVYDGSRDRTDETFDTAESESFQSNYLFEVEILPIYWPEMRLKVERNRDYEESKTEKVTKTLELDLRKEYRDLVLEFNLNYEKIDETLPDTTDLEGINWAAKAAYKSVVWWDVDVDLTYEIQEDYSEEFVRGVFTEEEKDYVQAINFRLRKSLDLTPRITGGFQYEYEFEQDLLIQEFDYRAKQEFRFDLAWQLNRWLDVEALAGRQFQYERSRPPEEGEDELTDIVELNFTAAPWDSLTFAGKAQWEWEKQIDTETGASVEKEDTEKYELAVQHRWGNWWELSAAGSNEFGYTNDWLTVEEAKIKAGLRLTILNHDQTGSLYVVPAYEITRTIDYEFNEPLALKQTQVEEFHLRFEYTKSIGSLIFFGVANDFGVRQEETVDEVMNVEEITEITEDTKIKLEIVDFIRDMQIEGEVTRKATDTKDDEEPMLVDITYALKWEWVVNDIDLAASYKYDDNGDTFDESTFNTKVAWRRENVDISGEYQFDKTYSYDIIDEERKVNLKMNIVF